MPLRSPAQLIAGCSEEDVKRAAEILRGGGVAVFPTDTVYGIGCDPYDKEAVGRVYKIKNRDESKPLPVLVHHHYCRYR